MKDHEQESNSSPSVLQRCHVTQHPFPLPFLPSSSPLRSPCIPPSATPDIAQHSSGPPHRVPLCQWAEREGTAQPLTTCCHWTHLRRPQNYCVAFSPTPLPVSISSLVPSPTPSGIPPFLPMSPAHPSLLNLWNSATINRLHLPPLKKRFITSLSFSKRPLMKDQGFKAGERSHPKEKGRRKRVNGVIYRTILLYKIPAGKHKEPTHLCQTRSNQLHFSFIYLHSR